MLNSKSSTIEVYFSGRAVNENSMSVRDLAPALIGLADAIDRYREINDPLIDLDVRITATKAGSFDVFLQLVGTMAAVSQTMEPSDIIGLASNVMDVIRILAIRFDQTGTPKPGEREVVGQSDTHVNLRIGSASLTVDRKAYRASRDGHIINGIGAAAHPSTIEGYDPVRFIHKDSGRIETIDKDAATAMSELTISEQPIDPSEETTTLQVNTIQFNSPKWKFTKGDETFWCEIQDQAFLNQCARHEISFGSGDLLKVRLITEQYVQDGQLKTGSRRITKVIEHMPIEQQPQLNI